ncbi:lipoprotein [Spiroplasma endosymbiont of Polydrusus pterygomalis]|uniref:lipoprotein n=1 Tax=Spiroplasma endosymbiont of Polydrusus pterygomalis TaxID=3139327 RepID=UPI003CCB2623
MKKILNILWSITLIGTSTTSLVACNTPQYSEEKLKEQKENQIDTKDQAIRDNLEWIAPQEKPFNEVDNKWYYVVWRGNKNNDWRIIKFKNYTFDFKKIDNFKNADLWKSSPYRFSSEQTLHIVWTFELYWEKDNGSYFKFVYRWNSLNIQEPDLVIDEDGNLKVK